MNVVITGLNNRLCQQHVPFTLKTTANPAIWGADPIRLVQPTCYRIEYAGAKCLYASRALERLMDDAQLRGILLFLQAEEHLPKRFDLPDEAFLPLFFSLRFGGAWCYASTTLRTVAIVKKTTMYDDTTKTGVTLEEIFLFVNPELVSREGSVYRLEKCGEEEERLLVERPFRVGIESERIIRMTVNPGTRQISTCELPAERMDFEGSTAFNIAHEMEHLEETTIKGKHLWDFLFV